LYFGLLLNLDEAAAVIGAGEEFVCSELTERSFLLNLVAVLSRLFVSRCRVSSLDA
jgi:hypothetical protein